MVKEPFELLVFDHHTDMQRPAFGGILSCGGWIREALETNENLKHVILVGPPETAMEETKRELLEDGEELIRKVTWISEEEFLQNVEKPDGIKKLCGQCKENDLGADEKIHCHCIFPLIKIFYQSLKERPTGIREMWLQIRFYIL